MNDVCRSIAQCLQIAAEARAKAQGAADDGSWFVWGLVGLAVLPQIVGLLAMGLAYWWAEGGSLPRLIITRHRQRGMVLPEILVVLCLILSLGLLTIAAAIAGAR